MLIIEAERSVVVVIGTKACIVAAAAESEEAREELFARRKDDRFGSELLALVILATEYPWFMDCVAIAGAKSEVV